MLLLVKQELFKLRKKKSTWILSLLLVVAIIGVALLSKKYSEVVDPPTILSQLCGATAWIVFIMIAASSTTIAMESQYGTIKNLLYRKYSRGKILASKWLTLLLYSFYLYVLSFLTTVLVKYVLFPTLSFNQTLSTGQSLISSIGIFLVGSFIGLWLILSLVLMLACFINGSAAAISVGIVFYFASSMLASLLFAVIQKWEWVKWNPINMMNLQNQVGNEEMMSHLTRLSNAELIVGNVIYIILFLGLGYFVFKKKNV